MIVTVVRGTKHREASKIDYRLMSVSRYCCYPQRSITLFLFTFSPVDRHVTLFFFFTPPRQNLSKDLCDLCCEPPSPPCRLATSLFIFCVNRSTFWRRPRQVALLLGGL